MPELSIIPYWQPSSVRSLESDISLDIYVKVKRSHSEVKHDQRSGVTCRGLNMVYRTNTNPAPQAVSSKTLTFLPFFYNVNLKTCLRLVVGAVQ